MTINGPAVLGVIGPLSIGVAFFVLGRLSYRLGEVTHARPYYIGLYLAAVLIWMGGLAQLIDAFKSVISWQSSLLMFLRALLPAAGVTLGLAVTWYYWSWLLAERD